MALVTPSRVSALAWLGLLGGLGWYTAHGTPWSWSDVDSVPRLTPERACELAKVRGLEAASCSDFTSTDEWASLTLREGALVRTACFLRAGRWFLVDRGRDLVCPQSGSHEQVRSAQHEAMLESQLIGLAVSQRNEAVRRRFFERVSRLAHEQREHPAPLDCTLPTVTRTQVPALDLDLADSRAAPAWHFLTTDTLEAGRRVDGDVGAVLQRLADRDEGLLFVVDATEKRLPSSTSPGRLAATLLLVDWVHQRVWCAAPLEVELEFDTVFKHAVKEALRRTASTMTHERLELQATE